MSVILLPFLKACFPRMYLGILCPSRAVYGYFVEGVSLFQTEKKRKRKKRAINSPGISDTHIMLLRI